MMTPEREKNIKLTADIGMSPECRGYFYELFEEIDRLRDLNESYDRLFSAHEKIIQVVRKLAEAVAKIEKNDDT